MPLATLSALVPSFRDTDFLFSKVLLRKKRSKKWILKDLMIACYRAFLWNKMYMYICIVLSFITLYDTDTLYELPLKASSIKSPESWLKPAGQWLAIGPYPGGMVICRYDGAGTAVAIRNWSGMKRRKPRSGDQCWKRTKFVSMTI